ncbi:hypothetical protein GKZ90_0013725 [Flavobacterium sp. MC2016-06]|jgi:hypothetical protein|uniref:hypothetical protein n=1 Tax=Flavobacterium sp. MC2016-06 TaxID=2676308 RepID=UPI0012BAA227|nr:hypothetical protein [Flavobacterium sp. MC2016-06]MBU3861773.1 hypothetical protein [Flavobacterium sp. MC2016-06]
MTNKNLQSLTLYNFSVDYYQINFDNKDINKPIVDLSLEDINWCLRKRLFLDQIIDITIQKIENDWEKIDIFYPTTLCQWYDDAIKEIVTIPFDFWRSRIAAFHKIQKFIVSSTKRKIEIEQTIIDHFINHKPTPICWTKKDSDDFNSNLDYALGMDIAGNLIEAYNQIKRVKYALMHGQSVFIEQEYKSISTDEELYTFLRDLYSESEEILLFVEENIIDELKTEKRI